MEPNTRMSGLKHTGAARVIGVAMRDENVFQPRRKPVQLGMERRNVVRVTDARIN
jgi:hypothetical protein